MRELLFASSNTHKIQEVKDIIATIGIDWTILTLKDFPELAHEVEETGLSYQDNALLKARSYATKINLPILADDSGVDVSAFPKLLSVHSARWHDGSDYDRTQALWRLLQDQEDRRLSYICVLCLLFPNQQPRFFEGECKGFAADVISSESGFGYDPLFIPDGYQETFNELGSEIKNQFSHRRQALNQLSQYLETHINID